MKEVLKTYKERLINLNASNRSLVLKKIYKKRAFDLKRLIEMKTMDEDALVPFLVSRSKASYQLMDDPFKLRVKRMKALEKQTEVEKDEEVEILRKTVEDMYPLTEQEMQVMIKREEEIDHKYALLIEEEKQSLEEEIKKIINYSNQINYLVREIKAVERETGKYELFVGYPFVEGKFNDGSLVRGPLLLFPVEAIKKDNKWVLKNIVDQDILINKVLAFAYAKYNNIKLTDFTTEFSTLEDFGENPIKGVIDYVNEHKLVASEPSDWTVQKFKDYTNKTFPNYELGEMNVIPYAVMGQFPLSNSIYTDYQLLENDEVEDELLEALLLNQEVDVDKEKARDEKELLKPLSEHDTFFFTQLDYSQENAVSNLMTSKQLVIYGPPGTGKSHTIANIISDGLCKNKKILMVSQKRAALDVIYNRLSDLKTKMVLIHDANKDKKAFYQKVTESIDDKALKFDLNKRIHHDTIATKIDEKVVGLDTIAATLMSERPFGLSLQEMYVKTRGIFDTEDERFAFYKIFRRDNPFVEYNYEQLREALDHMREDDLLIQQFSKYRFMMDENPYMNGFKHKMDLMSYEDVVEGTKQIQTLMDELKDENTDAYRAFGKYYYENKASITPEGISEAAKAYNHSLNHHLVDEEDASWWQLGKSIEKLAHAKERKSHKQSYHKEEDRYIQLFKGFTDMVNLGQKALALFIEDLNEHHHNKLEKKFIESFFIQEDLNQLMNSLDAQSAFMPLMTKVQSLLPLEKKILDYVVDHTNSQQEMGDLLSHLMEYIILEQISEIEKSEEFNEFYLYFNMYIDNVDEITSYMTKKNNLTKEIATSIWNDQFQIFIDTPNFREFKRQAEKKRLLWPIRKYIIEFSDMLLTLFPCWLLSPETVSDIFPLKQDLFDIVIFDEASQIFVENAIPTIYRGKTVVIAGDDKQLQPTSMFMTKYDDYDEEETTIENVAAFEEESLLDLAKVNFDSVHLNYHYRSRFEELINFSNYAFYNGNLNISPNIKHTKALAHPPIEQIKVDGLWEQRKNQAEASRVVELVAEILKNRKKEETVGIITFNITQKDLIEDLLEARLQYDKDFKKRYLAEKNRFDGNEDVSIFVKNIENVQGDERDIIIFSVGYAKNPEGVVSVNFGSLSQNGGENRLNVAISRAKRKVYVVTSIEPEELKVNDTLNMGPKLFRKYLEYAKAVSDRDDEALVRCLSSLSEIKNLRASEKDEFVTAVAKELEERGHEVLTDIGGSESKIDLAILHPKTKEFVLGIECDGKTYRSIPSVRERDIHRKRFLESRGWEMTRIWSIDWWKNPMMVIDKIEHFLNILLDAEELPKQDSEAATITSTPDMVLESYPESAIGFGDQVFIKDTMTKETFDVAINGNPATRDLMNEFKRSLLGKSNGDLFVYEGFEYQIVKIRKRK